MSTSGSRPPRSRSRACRAPRSASCDDADRAGGGGPGRRRLPQLLLHGRRAGTPLDRSRARPRALLRRPPVPGRGRAPPGHRRRRACWPSPAASPTTSHAVFGPDRRAATDGHPEIEMALVELYRETGERRYLELAAFFLDQRGHGRLGPTGTTVAAYFQDRVPVREATELEGHAVRALYLDRGRRRRLPRDRRAALLDALHAAVGRHGRAASSTSPAASARATWPRRSASRTSCRTICLRRDLRRDRQHHVELADAAGDGRGRFADLIERTLYNAVLSGVSLDGERLLLRQPAGQQRRGRAPAPRRVPAQAVAPGRLLPAERDAAAGVARALRRDARRHGLQIHQYARRIASR